MSISNLTFESLFERADPFKKGYIDPNDFRNLLKNELYLDQDHSMDLIVGFF